MKHAPPQPPELGERDRLSYALFRPEGEPAGAVVVLHGAGSAKESHFDYGRLLRSRGHAAICFDARGHGRSKGSYGPGILDDVATMLAFARELAPVVALRGSSMGGFGAIHGATHDGDVDAVVAICPAPADLLLRGIRSGRIEGFDRDEALEPWLETLDMTGAVRALSPRTALMLVHARGDEQVPWTVTEELGEAAGEPKRVLIVPGGHHRSLQHDGEIQDATVRWIERAFSARRRGS